MNIEPYYNGIKFGPILSIDPSGGNKSNINYPILIMNIKPRIVGQAQYPSKPPHRGLVWATEVNPKEGKLHQGNQKKFPDDYTTISALMKVTYLASLYLMLNDKPE